MNILMIGVNDERLGGMWTVSKQYIDSYKVNNENKLFYVATSTNGSILKRVLRMFRGYIKIIFLLYTKNIDIVHIHMAEKGSTFRKGRIVLLAKRLNKKVIIHLHAGPFLDWYNNINLSKKNKVRNYFGKADKILVLGEYWKKSLSKICEVKKIEVLYNGIDISSNNLYKIENRYIIYMGVMTKEKGIFDLLEAIKNINNILEKDIKVLLCGNDLTGKVKSFIDENNLNERVEMVGWISGEKKKKILLNAMISILPSYYEGLSMSVIESMSYGIPVVTTNISTMPEIFGEYKYLLKPGDVKSLEKSIIELTGNNKLRKNFSEYVYYRVNKLFSIDLFINRTLKIYNELMK